MIKRGNNHDKVSNELLRDGLDKYVFQMISPHRPKIDLYISVVPYLVINSGP